MAAQAKKNMYPVNSAPYSVELHKNGLKSRFQLLILVTKLANTDKHVLQRTNRAEYKSKLTAFLESQMYIIWQHKTDHGSCNFLK